MKIRTRSILVVLIAAFLTLSIFSVLQIKYQYDRDYQQYIDKILYYDHLIEEFIRLPLWNLDNEVLQAGVEGLLAEPDIVGIAVRDSIGSVNINRNKPISGQVTKHLLNIYRDDNAIGQIDIIYQPTILIRNTRDTVFGFGLMGILLLLVLGTVVILSAWTITRPLYRIIAMVQGIGKNMREHLTYPFKGELADLAQAINRMIDDLRERELTIQQVSAESATSEMKLRMERELRRQSDEHREELQASLETLRQARQQLITSEKMALLGSLVAGVAHEINTPIGVSVTAASYLNDKTQEFRRYVATEKMTKQQLDEYINNTVDSLALVLSNLDRAASLIRSFKLVSVDQSSESIRTFDFGIYIMEVIRSLHPQLRTKDLDIQVECPSHLMVHSYPGAFSQILTNLIINSLVHGFGETEKGCIRIEVTQPEQSKLRLFYADDGRGMPEATLVHLFEPFYTSMQNSGGSGLGTYIIYNLVTQRLEGSIHAINLASGGLAFTMDFPIEYQTQDDLKKSLSS